MGYQGLGKLDDYVLIDELGEGFCGKVYKGRDSQNGEIYALKVIGKFSQKKVRRAL